MDGLFVDTKSFPAEKINELSTSLSFEVHLMVKDPFVLAKSLKNPGLKMVIFHYESDGDHRDLIEAIRGRGLRAGMAIKPETRMDECREIAAEVDILLFLNADPCCYGNPFKPEVLEKVARARQLYSSKTISVDGGVSFDNLKLFFDIGVDSVCVGNRIFLHGNPNENYTLFTGKVGELEKSKIRLQKE
jgi:ribulose-phosphate 3-epimerase